MQQKPHDFVKDKRTRLVISNNDDYYQKIKELRQKDKDMKEVHDRISALELEIRQIKELLRSG